MVAKIPGEEEEDAAAKRMGEKAVWVFLYIVPWKVHATVGFNLMPHAFISAETRVNTGSKSSCH
jgi:hypothetical protein